MVEVKDRLRRCMPYATVARAGGTAGQVSLRRAPLTAVSSRRDWRDARSGLRRARRSAQQPPGDLVPGPEYDCERPALRGSRSALPSCARAGRTPYRRERECDAAAVRLPARQREDRAPLLARRAERLLQVGAAWHRDRRAPDRRRVSLDLFLRGLVRRPVPAPAGRRQVRWATPLAESAARHARRPPGRRAAVGRKPDCAPNAACLPPLPPRGSGRQTWKASRGFAAISRTAPRTSAGSSSGWRHLAWFCGTGLR